MLIFAVSSCLLGNPVRYDGRAKPEPSILAAAEYRWIPLCPECACGMPVPRPPIHRRGARLAGADGRGDWSDTMRQLIASEAARLRALGVCGAVFKSRSPSCGVTDTPRFDDAGRPAGFGAGFFVEGLRLMWPELPVIDENGWRDPEKRAEFLSAACKLPIL